MITWLRLAPVIFLIAIVTLILLPFQLLALKLKLRLSKKIPLYWHRFVCRVIGLRVSVKGRLSKNRPLLIVANHISWTDILVLGSIDEVSFISKHEVGDLPGAGFLARLQRTVFIVRDNKRDVGRQAREITARLVEGDAMVLFAEGTTGDGQRVMKFKSALFGAAQYAVKEGGVETVYVQPVCLAYTKLHGMPLGRTGRLHSAWTGDMTLGPHVAKFLSLSAWDVEVHIGNAVEMDHLSKRPAIANETYHQIRNMFVTNIYGEQKSEIH